MAGAAAGLTRTKRESSVLIRHFLKNDLKRLLLVAGPKAYTVNHRNTQRRIYLSTRGLAASLEFFSKKALSDEIDCSHTPSAQYSESTSASLEVALNTVEIGLLWRDSIIILRCEKHRWGGDACGSQEAKMNPQCRRKPTGREKV